MFCSFSTLRVLLCDNGAEFSNKVLEEICKQFITKHIFTLSYHPTSNGLVERASRKIMEILRPVATGSLDTWEDWLHSVAARINNQ